MSAVKPCLTSLGLMGSGSSKAIKRISLSNKGITEGLTLVPENGLVINFAVTVVLSLSKFFMYAAFTLRGRTSQFSLGI